MTLKPVFRSPADAHYYFGYYDKSPLDQGSTRHLAMRVNFIDRQPTIKDTATIGFFDLMAGNFVELTNTNTFNWQQGAMLQWRGPDFFKEIVFNRFVDGSYRTVLLDVVSGSERLLHMPVYAMHPDGSKALCIDFERHYWCRRGYAYDGPANPHKNHPIVPGDGIWILDINMNLSKMRVGLDQLMGISPLTSMLGATHYLEHIMFSPSGEKFSFLHRWKLADGSVYTRLYVADLAAGDPQLIHDSGRLTHYSWCDDNHIFAWGGAPTMATSLRRSKFLSKFFVKPLLPFYKAIVKGNSIIGQSHLSRVLTGDSYLLINVGSGNAKRQFHGVIDRDGHPSMLPCHSGWMVADTYPDHHSNAQLIVGNLDDQRVLLLDTLRSIPRLDNSPYRCDLHPKVSYDGRYVSVDTMNVGVRSIYLYELPAVFVD